MKWKPSIDDRYHFIDFDSMSVDYTYYSDDYSGNRDRLRNNVFRTKKQAVKALSAIKKILKDQP